MRLTTSLAKPSSSMDSSGFTSSSTSICNAHKLAFYSCPGFPVQSRNKIQGLSRTADINSQWL